jgi:hypothetical protein
MRQGTTTISSSVILFRISRLRLPKGCAEHTVDPRDVKAGQSRKDQTLAVFKAIREQQNPEPDMRGENAPDVIASEAKRARPLPPPASPIQTPATDAETR